MSSVSLPFIFRLTCFQKAEDNSTKSSWPSPLTSVRSESLSTVTSNSFNSRLPPSNRPTWPLASRALMMPLPTQSR